MQLQRPGICTASTVLSATYVWGDPIDKTNAHAFMSAESVENLAHRC